MVLSLFVPEILLGENEKILKLNMPKVSVITPLYNGKKYIEKAINSILNQTYKDFEIIIVDDGSIDGSGELVKDKFDGKVRYIYQENKGAASAVNKGVYSSKGDYIAFLESDDYWELKNSSLFESSTSRSDPTIVINDDGTHTYTASRVPTEFTDIETNKRDGR